MVDANATLAKIVYSGELQALFGETGKKLCKARRRFDAHMAMAKWSIERAATSIPS